MTMLTATVHSLGSEEDESQASADIYHQDSVDFGTEHSDNENMNEEDEEEVEAIMQLLNDVQDTDRHLFPSKSSAEKSDSRNCDLDFLHQSEPADTITTSLPCIDELPDFSELSSISHLDMHSHLDILDDFVHARDYDPDAAIHQYYQEMSSGAKSGNKKSAGGRRKRKQSDYRPSGENEFTQRHRADSEPGKTEHGRTTAGSVEAGDALHQVQNSFCRNFSCCGLVLNDLHDLLQHYEECHVRVVEEDGFVGDCPSYGSLNQEVFDTCNSTAVGNQRRSTVSSLLYPPTPVASPKQAPTQHTKIVSESMDSPRSILPGTYSAFDDSFISTSGIQNRHSSESTGHAAVHATSSAGGSNSMLSSMFTPQPSMDNPLIRRVGDIEDDLSMRYLEMINEEIERDGKRVKLVAEDVVGVPGFSNKRQSIKKSQNASRHQGVKQRIVLGDGQSGAGFSDDDEMIDVVTVESAGQRRIHDRDLSLYPFAASTSAFGAYAESRDGSVGELDDYDEFDSSIDEKTGRKREFPIVYDEFGQRIEKPYRCTHFGCDKAYKNPNGLKYHMQHGHCEGADEELDFALRFMKPYVCNFHSCYKRYKNLNGLKYHIEKQHQMPKADANQLATQIVKQTNAEYGINARSVPNSVLFAAMKEKEEKEKGILISDKLFETISKAKDLKSGLAAAAAVINSSNSGHSSSNKAENVSKVVNPSTLSSSNSSIPLQSSILSNQMKAPVPLAPKISGPSNPSLQSSKTTAAKAAEMLPRSTESSHESSADRGQNKSGRRFSTDSRPETIYPSTSGTSSSLTLQQIYHAVLQQALKSPAVSQLPTQQQAILMNMLSNANSPNHTMTPQQYAAAIAALSTIIRTPTVASVAKPAASTAASSYAPGSFAYQQALALKSAYSNLAQKPTLPSVDKALPTAKDSKPQIHPSAEVPLSASLTNPAVATTLQLLNNPSYMKSLAAHGLVDYKNSIAALQTLNRPNSSGVAIPPAKKLNPGQASSDVDAPDTSSKP